MTDVDELTRSDNIMSSAESRTRGAAMMRGLPFTALIPRILRTRRERWIALAALLALCIAGVTAAIVHVGSGLPAGVVAKVNGTSITESDLDNRIQALKALYGLKEPSAAGAQQTFRQDAAKSAVFALVVDDAAKRQGIVFSAKQVDDMLARLIKSRYPDGGRSAFIQALGDMGATEAQVRDELEQQAVVGRLFDSVTADVTVTPSDVKHAFAQQRGSLGTPRRRAISNIVVKTRAQAQEILRLLRAGRSFASLARSYSLDGSTRSKGGVMGVASEDQLDTTYGKAAFAARIGVPFGPIQTTSGWHVGIATRQYPAQPAVYSQVASSLETTLETEAALKAWQSWMQDQLRTAQITYAAAYRPADPYALPSIPGSPAQ